MGRVRNRRETHKKQPKRTIKNTKTSEAETNFFTKCFSVLLCLVAAFGVVAVTGYYRAPFTALSIDDISGPAQLVGALAPNRRLTKGFKVTGLPGPEAFVEDKEGNVYTSLLDGRVVKIRSLENGPIKSEDIINVTSGLFPDLPRAMKGRANGRALGLRLRENTLFVADANFGLYSIDLNSHQVKHLVTVDATNPSLGMTDDIYITKKGNYIYFTDCTAKYTYKTMVSSNMEGLCDGRILQYNVETKDVRTVVSKLCFANGIQFSEDENLLLVSETTHYRVRIIDVSTWKTIRNVELPIKPDNIRPTGKGTYWVAGGMVRDNLMVFMQRNPLLRQIVSGLLSDETLLSSLDRKFNMIIEFSDDGQILQSLQDPDGSLTYGLTHASPLDDGRLILGTYCGDHIAVFEEKNVALGLQNA